MARRRVRYAMPKATKSQLPSVLFAGCEVVASAAMASSGRNARNSKLFVTVRPVACVLDGDSSTNYISRSNTVFLSFAGFCRLGLAAYSKQLSLPACGPERRGNGLPTGYNTGVPRQGHGPQVHAIAVAVCVADKHAVWGKWLMSIAAAVALLQYWTDLCFDLSLGNRWHCHHLRETIEVGRLSKPRKV